MDRLELRMSYGCADKRNPVVSVDVGDQISEQPLDCLRRRADMAGLQGTAQRTAADPVLPLAYLAGDAVVLAHQGDVNASQVVDTQVAAGPGQVDRCLSCGDIAQRLHLRSCGRLTEEAELGLCSGNPAS